MRSVTRKAQSFTSRPACPTWRPAPQRRGEAARRRRVPSRSCRVERLKPACRGRRPTSTRGQGRVAAACFLETFRATQGRRARLAQRACRSQPGRHAGGARPPGGHATGRPPCSCRPSSVPPGSTPVRQLVASTMHRNIRPPAHAHRERASGRHRQPRNGAPAETAAWLTWMAERGLHQSGRDATDGGDERLIDAYASIVWITLNARRRLPPLSTQPLYPVVRPQAGRTRTLWLSRRSRGNAAPAGTSGPCRSVWSGARWPG
jgi:hypothetical protein